MSGMIQQFDEYAGAVSTSPVFFDLEGMQRSEVTARREAAHRLVKAPKSRTRLLGPDGERGELPYHRQKARIAVNPEFVGPVVHTRVEVPAEAYKETHLRESKGPGQYTVIQFREWSQEYRIRTGVDIPARPPQAPEGERFTEMLSDRGARSIADSCHYMALQKGGYKTFITGTFSEEKRAAIAAGETTIQREVTRSMDAMKKMYLRGWTTSRGDKIAPGGAEFCYCWVVEIPKNEQGEENPHIHLMVDWRVPFELFKEWSQRLEAIWSNGYFHIEKIKNPEFAGAYMAKAAGYLTKGKAGEQGRVKGNRYGISKPARAPGWACMGQYELGVMGRLIAEVSEHIELKYAKQRKQRSILTAQRDRAPKKSKERIAIGERLKAVRNELNAVALRASKYQVICKGREAFNKFLGWSVSAGWNPDYRPSGIWITEFNRQQALRKNRAWWRRIDASLYEWRKAHESIENFAGFYADDLNREAEGNETGPLNWLEYESTIT